MYANAQAGYFKYQKTDFLNLTPAEIVDRLFKGLFSNITDAEDAIKENLVSRKGEKISRAIAIAGELQASLDMKKGGELSERLYLLYDFVIRELLMANMENSLGRLQTVKTVIRPVMDGWSQMLEKPQQKPTPFMTAENADAPPRLRSLQVAG